jgi:hypothetical protein
MVWKDAAGNVVPFFLQFGFGGSAWTDEAGGMFLDSSGVLWSFGPFACGGPFAICAPYAQYNNVPYTEYWSDPGCTGTAYVGYVHASIAFRLTEASGVTVRAAKNTANAAMQFLRSSGTPASCSNTIVHILAIPLSDAPIVAPPASLPFTLPLHPEMLP